MTSAAIPPFYDDLELSFEKAWAMLADGAINRRGAAHVPVVASIDSAGHPAQRVMILRQADLETRRLRFHTDVRSTKVTEITPGAPTSLLIYDAEEKVQLRICGIASIDANSAAADLAWEHSTTFARRCYMAEAAPGEVSDEPTSGLPSSVEGNQPTEEDLTGYRENFAVIRIEVLTVEFLYLANAGHRRAKWQWHTGRQNWSGNWLIP